MLFFVYKGLFINLIITSMGKFESQEHITALLWEKRRLVEAISKVSNQLENLFYQQVTDHSLSWEYKRLSNELDLAQTNLNDWEDNVTKRKIFLI